MVVGVAGGVSAAAGAEELALVRLVLVRLVVSNAGLSAWRVCG